MSPENTEVLKKPRAKPWRLAGVPLATRVIEAETVPVNKPWQQRKSTNQKGLRAIPIKSTIMAPPNVARKTMFLRP